MRELAVLPTSGASCMTRYTPARVAARPRHSGRLTLAALVVLGAVATAHAPAVITVRPGDTLWDLARRHGTSVSELQRLNGLDGRGTIYAGQSLTLGGASAPSAPAAPAARSHLVVRGDTLSTIAKTYGVGAQAIAQANGMTSTLVRLGRRLVIPGGSPAVGSVPTHNAGVRIPDTVRDSVARHRATLAARRLPSKSEAQAMVARTARRHGVDPSLALAVAYHESGFQQRVVSPVDAIGVMQVLPSTGRALDPGLDLLDTQDNITAGVLLLKQLVRSTGSVDKALAGYYQGLGSISRRGWLPQTHAYVQTINSLRARF
jgi:LysM repeat protein